MTHTLYRAGSEASQAEEVCWLVYTSKNINDENFPETARHLLVSLEAAGENANWGDTKLGTKITRDPKEIKRNLAKNSRLRGVFSSKKAAVAFLKDLKKKELNQSILISGIISELVSVCREVGLTPRYANLSLGVFGDTAKLPDVKTLSVTTMCGHHRISPKYVRALEEDVEQGRMSAEEAGKKLASLCLCGVFNPVRAAHILETGGAGGCCLGCGKS
jgi:hypothetical protein